jgi:NAD-dependent deacetylase
MAEMTLGEVAQAIADRVHPGSLLVVSSGAGISRASGIPTFRGDEGLWERHRAEDVATDEVLRRDPAFFWRFHDHLREVIAEAVPNPAHFALADLEEATAGTLEHVIITQNIDRLHQRAGSSRVLELHGDALTYTCMSCGVYSEDLAIPAPEYPPLCEACGGILRPNVVLFGEALPAQALDDAREAAEHCDVMLVVGTSVVVEPAASLPFVAVASGALVVEVNPATTALTGLAHYSVQSPAGTALPVLCEEVKARLRGE